MHKKDLHTYLDSYLNHVEFTTDSSKNGLQIDTLHDEITTIGYAVDSTTYIVEKAIAAEVDLLLTHHGLFWGRESTITGVMFDRVQKYISSGIALYASHLPLDAHEEVGNNIGLAKGRCNTFGIQHYDLEPFGVYNGKTIGQGIRFELAVSALSVISMFCQQFHLRRQFHNFGKKELIRSVAFVSGGGGECLMEAYQKGYDLLITGEAVHRQITLAKEMGQSILLGGHYETETIGVKLLAHHLEKKFGVKTMFLDEKY